MPMSEDSDNVSPDMVSHLVAAFSRMYDRHPNDLELIHQVTLEHLKGGPKVSIRDPFEHVGQHLKDIYPAVMRDPRIEPVQARLLSEYAKMPATPATRLRAYPGDHSIPGAIVFGGAIGVAVAAVIVGYCLGGPDPAPGESVEVRC
jgi:hypothetical protein